MTDDDPSQERGVAMTATGMSGRAAVVGIALAAVFLSGSLAAAARAPAGKALSEGVYTKVQAERGEKLFDKVCVECHLPVEFERYVRSFVGLPVSFLFDSLQTTMPQDNPGGLTRDEYADVLTYLFELNGFPQGDAEMKSEAAELDGITIDRPPRQAGAPGR